METLNDMMHRQPGRRASWATLTAGVAIVFGFLTIISGGIALFADGVAIEQAVGDAVPFVLWFNFIAGFAYIIAGIGLFRWRLWSARLSLFIALATTLVLVAFAIHVALGKPYEVRTVAAILLRWAVWSVIAIAACRALGCRPMDKARGR